MTGEWQGQLAEEFGLSGAVGAEEFARLSEGQHPATGDQLVRHRQSHQYQTADGKTVKSVEHRAGWDATFSAPKSVSLTALVGGDERVRMAHREAVTVALSELEHYTQARIGGNHPPETTGQICRRQVRARHRPSSERLRRAAASHPRGHLQYDRARRWHGARAPAAESLRIPAVRHGGLPIGADVPAPQSRLRDRTGQERSTGDQRLLAGVP